MLAAYDRFRDYDFNYQHAPEPVERQPAPVPGDWRFCGLPVDSPLGVPAGPLLNGKWCLYYASLGFDVVTYKTVRSSQRDCYALPNLQPVACGNLFGGETSLSASDEMSGSWAVSFGMPSKSPEIWRKDIEQTRRRLAKGKLLSVSVVGTVQESWSIDQLADDYAQCAKWAVESGADCVETNFSCPNVSTCDGQLYQQTSDAATVAAKVRSAVGTTPYIAKIGRIVEKDDAAALLEALAPHVDALALTNSVAATVEDSAGRKLFEGEKRGICGAAILKASVDQTEMMKEIIDQHAYDVELIGVGGVGSASDVQRYLQAGAHAVHLATAAMIDPEIGLKIRRNSRDWAASRIENRGLAPGG